MTMLKKLQVYVLTELSMFITHKQLLLIRTYCTYWNKAGYLHKLLLQQAAVLQVPV